VWQNGLGFPTESRTHTIPTNSKTLKIKTFKLYHAIKLKKTTEKQSKKKIAVSFPISPQKQLI
jgi:RNase H-fold protein (predicted Holliday junction resolvase)